MQLKQLFRPLIIHLGKRKQCQHFSDPPIFIGGCARSGTTLLLSILSAHPAIFACPKELGLFNKIKWTEQGYPQPKKIHRLYQSFLTNKIAPTNNRWCEKSPNNIYHLTTIDQYFEGKFKFIQIIRDGRDVILSRHPTAKDQYWVEPERWIQDVKQGLEVKDHPKVHTIYYEDLLRDFTNTMLGICDFLDLPFAEELKNWHMYATVKRNRAYENGLQQLNKNSIGKWKQPANETRVNQLVDNPEGKALLKQLGYLKN